MSQKQPVWWYLRLPLAARYVGTFAGKLETRHAVSALTDLYKLEEALVGRIRKLEGGKGE